MAGDQRITIQNSLTVAAASATDFMRFIYHDTGIKNPLKARQITLYFHLGSPNKNGHPGAIEVLRTLQEKMGCGLFMLLSPRII